MPSKSSRAASRQAKLRQKKRHGRAAPQTFEVGPAESTRSAEDANSDEDTRSTLSTRRATPDSASPRPTRRSAQLLQTEEAPRYEYLGAELRRIGIFTAGILVILLAASFVLGI